MTPLETGLLTTGAGAVGGLGVKIVWDWLKSGRDNGFGRKCRDHESCIVTLTSLKGSAESNKERLKKGDEQMAAMAKDIKDTARDVSSIKADVKVLVSRFDSQATLYQKARKLQDDITDRLGGKVGQ